MNNSNYLLNYINRLMHTGNDPEKLDYAAKHIDKAKNFFPWPGITFVLDLRTGKYLHLSKHLPEQIQHHYHPMLENGFAYMNHIVPHGDFFVMNEIVQKIFDFIKRVPKQEIENYWFTHNFRVKNQLKTETHLVQHFIINEVDKHGLPLLVSGVAMDIDPFTQNSTINFSISSHDKNKGRMVLSHDVFFPDQVKDLTKREAEITKLICEGHSNEYISKKLYISYHTAKTHRKNIYEKTNSKNVAELFRYFQLRF